MQILQEITPLQEDRLYMSWYYYQNQLDFPIHYHEDYAKTYRCNTQSADCPKGRNLEETIRNLWQ